MHRHANQCYNPLVNQVVLIGRYFLYLHLANWLTLNNTEIPKQTSLADQVLRNRFVLLSHRYIFLPVAEYAYLPSTMELHCLQRNQSRLCGFLLLAFLHQGHQH